MGCRWFLRLVMVARWGGFEALTRRAGSPTLLESIPRIPLALHPGYVAVYTGPRGRARFRRLYCAVCPAVGVFAMIPRLLLLVFVLLLAAGCGQKGPLYMPDESQDESTEENDD